MNLKTGFYIFCSVIMVSMLGSCLGGDDNTEVILPIDAQITSFKAKHDSVKALDSIYFSIDHFNGLIYNHDSLRYGTKINEKVVVTFSTSAYGVVDITRINNEEPDSVVLSSGDSLDLRQPAKLRVYSYSGISKVYEVKVNIHQVDPDSIRYWQIADGLSFLNASQTKSFYFSQKFYTYTSSGNTVKLYSSSDAVTWKEESLSGLSGDIKVSEIQHIGTQLFVRKSSGGLLKSEDGRLWETVTTPYPVNAIYGFIEKTQLQDSGFVLMIEKEGKKLPAFTSDFKSWEYGNELPSSFPMTSFSSIKYNKMSLDRVTVIGGKNGAGQTQNAVWSTSNGLYWAKLTDNNLGLFPLMDEFNVFRYNDMICLLNGRLGDDSYNKMSYFSKDGGMTWHLDMEKTYLPEDYSGRYGASVLVDKDNYLYIIGGKQDAGPFNDIWKGILNKLSFNKK